MTRPRPLYRVVIEIDQEVERLTQRLKELHARRAEIMRTPTARPDYYKRKKSAA